MELTKFGLSDNRVQNFVRVRTPTTPTVTAPIGLVYVVSALLCTVDWMPLLVSSFFVTLPETFDRAWVFCGIQCGKLSRGNLRKILFASVECRKKVCGM